VVRVGTPSGDQAMRDLCAHETGLARFVAVRERLQDSNEDEASALRLNGRLAALIWHEPLEGSRPAIEALASVIADRVLDS
jgi:hypothetical protein